MAARILQSTSQAIKFRGNRLLIHPSTTASSRAFSNVVVNSNQTASTSAPSTPSSVVQPTSQVKPRMTLPPSDDPLLRYITNHLMKDGQKQKAAKITTRLLEEIHKITGAAPLPILRNAIALASPSIRMKSHKRSAKSIMVPTPLNDRQRTFFAVKWLINASDSRNDRKIELRLAKEVIRVVEGESDVLKKKLEVHKLAVANRYVTQSPRMFWLLIHIAYRASNYIVRMLRSSLLDGDHPRSFSTISYICHGRSN